MCLPWENGLKSSAIGSPDFQLAQEETRPVAAVKGLLQFSFFLIEWFAVKSPTDAGATAKARPFRVSWST